MKTIVAVIALALTLISQAGCDTTISARVKEAKSILSQVGMDSAGLDTVAGKIAANPRRFFELLDKAMEAGARDSYLLRRVDKTHGLSPEYIPADLVNLDGTGLSVSRPGHSLRKEAFEAMRRMDKAAREAGLTLLVSSSYRSYEYQKTTFGRAVAEMGEKEAARVSARPGMSQHQLGMAVDFGSISDDFAATKASAWLEKNAGNFGFSLSYPRGMETITGYMWESWHYRYIGLDAAALQVEFFGNIQHYLLRFIELFRAAHTKG
jgi:D-alanyl-D-alanine carboxypeptidase